MTFSTETFTLEALKPEDASDLSELMISNGKSFQEYLPKTLAQNLSETDSSIYISNKNKALKIIIEDDARAFNPLEHKDPDDFDKPLEEREVGGLGIFFVKKMMDRVEYRHESNHNILIIEKVITSE